MQSKRRGTLLWHLLCGQLRLRIPWLLWWVFGSQHQYQYLALHAYFNFLGLWLHCYVWSNIKFFSTNNEFSISTAHTAFEQHQRWAGLVTTRSGHSFAFGVFQHVSATLKARWARCATRWQGSAPAAGRWMVSAAADVWLAILDFPTAAPAHVTATQSFATQWLEHAWIAEGLQLEAAVKGRAMGSTVKHTRTPVHSETCSGRPTCICMNASMTLTGNTYPNSGLK